MQWFGEPWPSAEYRAPVCEDDEMRIDPPPVWELCVLCNLPFRENARGVRMPHITAEGWTVERYCHMGCLLNNIGGEGISWEKEDRAELGQKQD